MGALMNTHSRPIPGTGARRGHATTEVQSALLLLHLARGSPSVADLARAIGSP